MLNCKTNRLDYGELLCPEDGYDFDCGIAATYSADLSTLLSIPVALVYAQTLEGDLSGARFQLLEAIRKFSSRVRVYHQKGQLHVPDKLNWLYAYLEDAVIPILPEDAFTVFHPKTWLIRYTSTDRDSGKTPVYRLIVLSRNLTLNRSWDVGCCLDGKVSDTIVEGNQSLVAYINWLDDQSPIPKRDKILTELPKVEFETPPPFQTHRFHPIGIPGNTLNPTMELPARNSLVISPFLHHKTVERLQSNTSGEMDLFSEKHELDKLPAEVLGQSENFHLSDMIVEGEHLENAEDGNGDIQNQHLHAKVFIFEVGESARWFLGSANATEAAAERNIEFMLELTGSTAQAGITRRKTELIGEKNEGPFVPYTGTGEKEEESTEDERLTNRIFEYALLKAPIEAKVIPIRGNSHFDLHVKIDLTSLNITPSTGDIAISVVPFNIKSGTSPQRIFPGTINECLFPNLGELELSRFLQFKLKSSPLFAREFLLLVEIDGLPEERLDNILRKIIDSSDKFFEYLRFLIADEITKEDILSACEDVVEAFPRDNDQTGWSMNLPIYEQLLVAASRQPQKLRQVDTIVQRLISDRGASPGKEIVPDAFLSFWEVFRPIMPEPEERGEV